MHSNDYSSARIDDFSPSRGHRIFVPTFLLESFRTHVGNMTAADRADFSPLSSVGRSTTGGEHFFIGPQRTHEEVMTLLIHVVIDD